jgi:hypothetical protein
VFGCLTFKSESCPAKPICDAFGLSLLRAGAWDLIVSDGSGKEAKLPGGLVVE